VDQWWPNGGQMVDQWWTNGGLIVDQWWPKYGQMVVQWWLNGGPMVARQCAGSCCPASALSLRVPPFMWVCQWIEMHSQAQQRPLHRVWDVVDSPMQAGLSSLCTGATRVNGVSNSNG